MRHGLIAWWLLDELRDEEHWERQFSASQDTLSKLAEGLGLTAYRQGELPAHLVFG
jgi:hypothetical protein